MFTRANKINDIYRNYGYCSENEDTIQIVPKLDHNPYPMMEVMQAFTQKTIADYENSLCHNDCNTK